MSGLITPSWKLGFARNADESENPGLWDGLAGLWAPRLGPTGLTLYDVSGRSNHGTLTNMDPATDWVTTEKGRALDFDGVDDYVAVPNPGSTLDGKAITISAWIKPVASGNSWPRIIDRVYNGQFALYVTEASSRLGFAAKGVSSNFDDPDVSEANSVPAGAWSHCVLVYDGSQTRTYINGKWNKTTAHASGVLATSTSVIRIGQRVDGGDSRAFEGEIESLGIYSRVLLPSEIQQLSVDPDAMLRLRQEVFPAAVTAPAGGFNYIIGGGILGA